MIKTTAMLLHELGQLYAWPAHKLNRKVKSGELIPIVKGLYEDDSSVPGYLLAGSIYGPSYLSFEFALSFYGMIPEAVYTFTSATYDKKKKKMYETPFGSFSYRDVPPSVYPLEIRLKHEGDYYFQIASPEKALCDQLYALPPVKNQKELQKLLFEDLRIDLEQYDKLDFDTLVSLSDEYHTTNLKLLNRFARRRCNEHNY